MKTTDPTEREFEKRHYTVDEMVDRLKHNSPGGKRRRRSQQPPKKSAKYKRILIVLGVAAGLLGAAIFFLGLLNQWRVESEGFRSGAGESIAATLKRKVELDRCKAENWKEFSTPKLRFPEDPSSIVASGNATTLRATLTPASFFNQEWDVRYLTISKLELNFHPAKPDGFQGGRTTGRSGTIISGQPAPDSGEWRVGVSSSPRKISLDGISVADLSLAWPSISGAPDYQLLGAQAHGSLAGSTFTGTINDGALQTGFLKGLKLHSAQIEGTWPLIQMAPLILQLGSRGKIQLQGTLDLAGASTSLSGRADHLELEDVLRPAWRRKIYGQLGLSGLSYETKPGTAPTLKGDFEITGPVFNNIPVLTVLGDRLDSNSIRKLEFSSLSGSFIHTPESLQLRDIRASHAGFARISGSITLANNGDIAGDMRLELKIPPGTPGFTDVADGLSWAEVKLSGNEETISDSLSPLLAKAAQKKVAAPAPPHPTPPPAPEAVPDPLGDEKARIEKAFDNLLDPNK